jgi:murein DD-endopeptidase MepM/ murein hydrolase activator NlpD
MPRIVVQSRSRACFAAWPRVAVLALTAFAAAGCSSSERFDSNPYASNRNAPQQEVTGSIAARPQSGRVETQPLPAPSRPATVASSAPAGGVAYGAQGLGAYRPGVQNSDITGSVPARRAPEPAPVGHWTWDGGSPVTVGQGETVESIARRHGVPASAILETNGIANAASIRPGQRLVIPRYVSASAAAPRASAPAAVAAVAPRGAEDVHIVGPGESLIGIARRHGVSLTALARANNIQPYSKIAIGDRLVVPGNRHVAARSAPAPRLEQPRTVPAQTVTGTTENARIAKPEAPVTESVTKTAEAVGALPQFRWPVRGRVIVAFGARTNSGQNDGINLAVPEGTPIKAADDGVVAYAGNELKGYGNLVLVRHANGYVSAYANASELMVKRGDTVKRGQVIAHAGQTGNVTSPQLHFEIRKGSTPVDPMQFLDKGQG